MNAGLQCGSCKPGFFHLDAANPAGCDPCDCDASKSTSALCDPVTGQCDCKPNVHGRRCDSCADGWYSRGTWCSKCACDADGTLPGTSCNSTDGRCHCKAYVVGQRCDTCVDGYYGSVLCVQYSTTIEYLTALENPRETQSHVKGEVKVKAFPYSITSVGSGADPGVQAVSLQVTVSHPPGGRLPLLSARPAVTSPAAEHHRPLAGIKLYCLVTEAHRCEQLVQGCYAALPRVGFEPATY